MSELMEQKTFIYNKWLNNENFIEELSSEEVFQMVVTFISDKSISILIQRDFKKILYRCSTDYDMFNYFTILTLKINGDEKQKEACNIMLENTVKSIFSSASLIFLMKMYKKVKEEKIYRREPLFKIIIDELKKMDTAKSSIILFDLFIFPDFKLVLERNHRTIATLIECYQLYGPDVVSSKIFVGSSIIGKLLQGDNEAIATQYLRDLLFEKQITPRNIQMIGGGGSSLVYRIGDKVIKFGETRNNRKIYIYHRLLASQIRKLELGPNDEELFYVEVMKNALVGDVTEEEMAELKQDLYDHGLIWDDDKLENCGVLVDGDENICDLPVDYIEVAGKVEAAHDRELFMKRERKVVVIDNDNIRRNPLKFLG